MSHSHLQNFPDTARADFGRLPFKLRHDLSSCEALQLPALARLSEQLPPERIEYNLGDLPLVKSGEVQKPRASVAETIEHIEQAGSWVVLKHIQTHPAYAELLDAMLDDVSASVGQRLFSRVAFVFISSPNAVTPLHIDPENNFLLQVRGSKTMGLFNRDEREVLCERSLERFYCRGDRHLDAPPEGLLEQATQLHLEPGDALHVPQHAPHFVRNGPEVSVSLSITCHTRTSDMTQGVYWCNRHLRQVGFNPSAPGRPLDMGKYAVYKTLRTLKRGLRPSGA